MENKYVATFVKVVEFNNFTKAAENLGYSQAAVTAQIKAMESELGVPLFDRIGKRIYLTQEGKTFLPYALNMLKAEQEAVASVRPTEDLTGELRIGSATSYASEVLPEILLKFQALHPGVSITVKVSDFLEDTTRRLTQGDIDFLLIMGEEDAYPEFDKIGMRYEPMVFVTYPGNPILKRKKVSAADVVSDSFIVSDRDIGYCELLDRQLRKQGIYMEPAMELGSVSGIIRVIMGGFGSTFIPEYAAHRYLEQGDLAQIPVQGIDIGLHTYFMCSRQRWINPIMKEFIRITEEYIGR